MHVLKYSQTVSNSWIIPTALKHCQKYGILSIWTDSSCNHYLLVYKCPDDSQCVQHQAIHILFLPSWLMGPSSSARWSDWVPGSTAPSLSSINACSCTMIHPPSLSSCCPRWAMMMIFQITILSANTAVSHGSRAGDHSQKDLPKWRKGV